jgi:hypothetical protein
MSRNKKGKDHDTAQTTDPAPLSRGAGIGVKMCCKELKNEWNFRAANTPDAIEKARQICKDSGYVWPSDVIVWEITQTI